MTVNRKDKIIEELTAECPVLLENDGTLPINKVGKIALFGNGARNTIKGGTGSGDVNAKEVINIEQGLSNAGYTVTTTAWLDRYEKLKNAKTTEYFTWLQTESKERGIPLFSLYLANAPKENYTMEITNEDIREADTDTAVYVVSRISGEGADRKNEEWDYLLAKEELENIKLLAANFDKFIVILNIGGIIDCGELKKISGIGAILLMGQLGGDGGNAIARILKGDVTPSGKLVDTWAKSCKDYPSSNEFSNLNNNYNESQYKEGIYVGYRYFDTFGVEPEYPFGYGLSYTDFSIEFVLADVKKDIICIKIKVENTGKIYSGKEVVQIYGSAPTGKLDKPSKTLIDFCKTKLLTPGEKEEIEISVPIFNMASFDEKTGRFILEKGKYTILIGNSIDNAKPCLMVSLDNDVFSQNVLGLIDNKNSFEDLKAYRKINHVYDVPEINIKAENIVLYPCISESFETNNNDVERDYTLEDLCFGVCSPMDMANQLTVEEMADFCVGASRSDSEKSVIGSAAQKVPGAAGETSDNLTARRRLPALIMADGPAGIRIQNNCTAIPIGWSIAQSWNLQLAREAGKIVGIEMEENEIDLWLAPALNIHRHPLCGRNFEYYSEDPYISGKMAAAIVNGVQSIAGKGATIKHFAANNQEDNRYFVNVSISERALREVYLKGFEIAVRESNPAAIMTSYNLLNGIHTANNKKLLDITRHEWGYGGVIMTDWFTSQDVPEITWMYQNDYPISSSAGCIYAGNDLQMPGCTKNVTDIVEAVNTGDSKDGYHINIEDLRKCAARVIGLIARLKGVRYTNIDV